MPAIAVVDLLKEARQDPRAQNSTFDGGWCTYVEVHILNHRRPRPSTSVQSKHVRCMNLTLLPVTCGANQSLLTQKQLSNPSREQDGPSGHLKVRSLDAEVRECGLTGFDACA